MSSFLSCLPNLHNWFSILNMHIKFIIVPPRSHFLRHVVLVHVFVVSSCTFEAHYCHFVIFSDDSQVAYVFIVLAIILFIVMVAMISVICIKSGKKKLPPADVIPEVSRMCCAQHWIPIREKNLINISKWFMRHLFSSSTAPHHWERLQRERPIFDNKWTERSRSWLLWIFGNRKHSDTNGIELAWQRRYDTQRQWNATQNTQWSSILGRLHGHACSNENQRSQQQWIHFIVRQWFFTRLQPTE